jgi:Gpi18-like mannosyltransferase
MADTSDLRSYLIIISVVVLSSILALAPFLLGIEDLFSIHFWQTGMQAVYRYWDGPLYVVTAHTLYAVESPLYAASGLWASYYAAILPFFPVCICLLSFLGSFEGMIVATVLFTCAAAIVFFRLVKDFSIAEHPLLLTVFFVFFPLRWFLYHNVGASEPAFIFLCLSSIYMLKKDRIEYSVIAASLAALTRIFGVLLFPVILVSLVYKRELDWKNLVWTLLIPASLLLLFCVHYLSFGDFFAYFNVNAANIHEPFRIMLTHQDSYFRELYGTMVIAYMVGAFALWERGEREMSLFILFFLPVTLLLTHGDVSRYMLPMVPFALIGFEKIFPENRSLFVILIVIAAILAILYTWIMIPLNPMPEETFQGILDTLAQMRP